MRARQQKAARLRPQPRQGKEPPFPSAPLRCHDESCSVKAFAKDSASLLVSLDKTATLLQLSSKAKETHSKHLLVVSTKEFCQILCLPCVSTGLSVSSREGQTAMAAEATFNSSPFEIR